jgi:hypothetical protein
LKILIQLESYIVSDTARTYYFQVMGEAGTSRKFCVEIPLDNFERTPLRYQDGPLISRERLECELDGEAEGLSAKTHLAIEKADIEEYMTRHYPPKARNWPRVMPSRNRSKEL